MFESFCISFVIVLLGFLAPEVMLIILVGHLGYTFTALWLLLGLMIKLWYNVSKENERK